MKTITKILSLIFCLFIFSSCAIVRGLKTDGKDGPGICEQVLYVNPHKNLVIARIGKSNSGPTILPVLLDQLGSSWHE